MGDQSDGEHILFRRPFIYDELLRELRTPICEELLPGMADKVIGSTVLFTPHDSEDLKLGFEPAKQGDKVHVPFLSSLTVTEDLGGLLLVERDKSKPGEMFVLDARRIILASPYESSMLMLRSRRWTFEKETAENS